MVPIGGSFCSGLASPMLNVDLLWARYFIRILFLRRDHVFHERDADYYTVNITEMSTHAYVIGTWLLFPSFVAWVRG